MTVTDERLQKMRPFGGGSHGPRVPAEALPPHVLKAWRAVITPPMALVPVGGIVPESIAPYAAAGASGFGLGSALYRPGDQAPEVAHKAAAFARAWQASFGTAPATA